MRELGSDLLSEFRKDVLVDGGEVAVDLPPAVVEDGEVECEGFADLALRGLFFRDGLGDDGEDEVDVGHVSPVGDYGAPAEELLRCLPDKVLERGNHKIQIIERPLVERGVNHREDLPQRRGDGVRIEREKRQYVQRLLEIIQVGVLLPDYLLDQRQQQRFDLFVECGTFRHSLEYGGDTLEALARGHGGFVVVFARVAVGGEGGAELGYECDRVGFDVVAELVDYDAECGDYFFVADFGHYAEVFFEDLGEDREEDGGCSFCLY